MEHRLAKQGVAGSIPASPSYEKNKLKKTFKSTSGKNIESYDVFIEQALRQLSYNGHLAFVLPEAILNVKAHTNIREIILQSCSIKNLDFLGNAFDGCRSSQKAVC